MRRKILLGNLNKGNATEDSDKEITEYTISNQEFDGTNHIDTRFVPFDGKNFEMTLKAKFTYADNPGDSGYPTLLNALEEISPYNGFLIRYEGSTLYFVHKSAHYNLSLDSNDYLNLTVTLKDGTLTVTNNSSQIATITVDYTLKDLTVYLGCSVDSDGNVFRYSKSTIEFFEIKKI